MKTPGIIARLKEQGRCACGRPRYVTKSGRMLSACAYCLDLSMWINRTKTFGIQISDAGERPQVAQYADNQRHLKPLPFKHGGREMVA
jgi:hypothetical protein